MSGYIRLAKDLLTDPRFKRLKRAYASNALRNGDALSDETVTSRMLGALAVLWIYADTHIREDDTLGLCAEEIDELVGIAGFCQILPSHWLKVLGPDSVELPDFLQHNGTDSRNRFLAAKRQSRFRARKKEKDSNASNATGHALRHGDASTFPSPPIPSHPIPNQTKQEGERESDGNGSNALPAVIVSRETDDVGSELLASVKAIYPDGIYRQADWLLSEREIRLRLEEGHAPEAMLAGCERYGAQVRAKGGEGGQYVFAPSRFFRERMFLEPFPLPAKAATATEQLLRNLERGSDSDRVIDHEPDARTAAAR